MGGAVGVVLLGPLPPVRIPVWHPDTLAGLQLDPGWGKLRNPHRCKAAAGRAPIVF